MRPYTSDVEMRLVVMGEQYEAALGEGHRWSLRSLFSTADCDIADYCRDFRPNRFGAQACREVEEFCRSHGIWLESGGAQYNSMTPYLHPAAVTAERMTIIGMFNAILFWLNDTVGREKFGHLSLSEQQRAQTLVDGLCSLLEMRGRAADSTGVEAATAELLAILADRADPVWLEGFLGETVEHLRPAIRDQNARARGGLLSVADYIDLRAEVSGMYPAIALCEFARDDYLSWDRVREVGLEGDVRLLRRLTAEIGALMNDVFSFEKECIVDGSDFNLIPICLLATSDATLPDAVHEAAHIVRDRLTQFRRIQQRTLGQCTALADTAVAESVAAHVGDLAECVRATWEWQITTLRYKGLSIFTENCLD